MGKIQFVSMLRWQEPELCLGCLSPAPKLEFQKVLGWVISKILHRAPPSCEYGQSNKGDKNKNNSGQSDKRSIGSRTRS